MEEARVLTVVKKIMNNRDKVTNVINHGGGDYWFLYDNKHKWFLRKRGPGFDLRLYNKGDYDYEQLSKREDYDELEYSEFCTSDIRDPEHLPTIKNLYNVIKYKDRDFDEDFTDILSDGN